MYKISQYSSTFELTKGFFIALLSSGFIYLNHWGFSHPIVNTILGITTLYLLLQEEKKVWFFSGAFIGLFWFWWIALSLQHYGMVWAVPIEIVIIMLSYGVLFWLLAWISEKIALLLQNSGTLLPLLFKASALFILSYIHPFSFDWFKPELMFVESYLGIDKWQYAIILSAIVLSLWKQQLLYVSLVVFAYQTHLPTDTKSDDNIRLVTTYTAVEEKWDETLHAAQFENLFKQIDQAIKENKTLVILPESVFPIFLNRSKLLERLQEKAKKVSIVTGGLYWDGKTPRNSTYIFTNNKISVANKVVLVPFGESNPLPDFLSDWVNKIFYDGAVDYVASPNVVDYQIDGKIYRNAICFEATTERLYEGEPKHMIALSNNGWFTPSIEPTLQKLLLQYYSKKYGTTIYHSVNMSESYVVKNGKITP
ncbi:apolipoprotein N-acyltransferase [Sulfurovum sp. XGS-02]|uniref:apolipoprotein N-acyltransferase n=1 Tax=Sulfurovum sp. XGS-02 TaxID=2925411 RepID=UPI00205B3312|nr:apolipoprotein N-acyltransferase [Sulfurovum sp. XGS-02]UPT77853.1 apolipoprotein N-acyltransferase [Sulfurovum sp. XGS-02]